jgi:tripartite-type tricarboxylate transporter receptor subunit TctC
LIVRVIHAAAAVVVGLLTASGVGAQSYPARSITLIAPFPAGGPSDAIGRILSEPMQASLGHPIIIDNVAGAGGNIGVGRLARAEPDGYTIGIGQWSTHVVNPVTYKLNYDVIADFQPIALLTDAPQIIIARKDFPARDLRELVAWLKANPDKANAATVGAAGGAQVAAVYFQQQTGTLFRFVSYRGGAPAMQDLVAGQVDLMFDQGANAVEQVRSGAIRAYATMAKSRWFAVPDIPTIDEAGVPGLHISYWHAMWAPKGTPEPIVARLVVAVRKALADPNARKRLAAIGHEIASESQQTPQGLLAYHKSEIEKWWPIVRATGLKAD